MKFIVALLLAMCYLFACKSSPSNESSYPGKGNIIITEQFTSDAKRSTFNLFQNRSFQMRSTPVDFIGLRTQWDLMEGKVKSNKIRWVLNSDKPLLIQSSNWKKPLYFMPGDSVEIIYNKNNNTYHGNGANALQLQHELEEVLNRLVAPARYPAKINSLNEYLKWKDYLDKRLNYTTTILNEYSDKVPPSVYNLIKANTIYRIERDRAESFMALYYLRDKDKTIRLTTENLMAICDSTMYGPSAKWLQDYVDYCKDTWYFYQNCRIQIWRHFKFDLTNDSLNTDSKRRILYYNTIKHQYQGRFRERLLQYVVADETIKELGYNDSVTVKILKDYYSLPGFPEYRQWMRYYEDSLKRRQMIAKKE